MKRSLLLFFHLLLAYQATDLNLQIVPKISSVICLNFPCSQEYQSGISLFIADTLNQKYHIGEEYGAGFSLSIQRIDAAAGSTIWKNITYSLLDTDPLTTAIYDTVASKNISFTTIGTITFIQDDALRSIPSIEKPAVVNTVVSQNYQYSITLGTKDGQIVISIQYTDANLQGVNYRVYLLEQRAGKVYRLYTSSQDGVPSSPTTKSYYQLITITISVAEARASCQIVDGSSFICPFELALVKSSTVYSELFNARIKINPQFSSIPLTLSFLPQPTNGGPIIRIISIDSAIDFCSDEQCAALMQFAVQETATLGQPFYLRFRIADKGYNRWNIKNSKLSYLSQDLQGRVKATVYEQGPGYVTYLVVPQVSVDYVQIFIDASLQPPEVEARRRMLVQELDPVFLLKSSQLIRLFHNQSIENPPQAQPQYVQNGAQLPPNPTPPVPANPAKTQTPTTPTSAQVKPKPSTPKETAPTKKPPSTPQKPSVTPKPTIIKSTLQINSDKTFKKSFKQANPLKIGSTIYIKQSITDKKFNGQFILYPSLTYTIKKQVKTVKPITTQTSKGSSIYGIKLTADLSAISLNVSGYLSTKLGVAKNKLSNTVTQSVKLPKVSSKK